jgi:hypothetical protein
LLAWQPPAVPQVPQGLKRTGPNTTKAVSKKAQKKDKDKEKNKSQVRA